MHQFRVFCESVPRQILLLWFPVLPGAATGTQVLQFDKKIRRVPHFLQPPEIDKEPESNAKMYVNQRRDEMARTWKHILRHDHFRAKYRYVGVFFERRFQPLSVGGFFSNQRESISRCPKSPFPSKTQNRQIARTSPLTWSHVQHTNQKRRHLIWSRFTHVGGSVHYPLTHVSIPPLSAIRRRSWSGGAGDAYEDLGSSLEARAWNGALRGSSPSGGKASESFFHTFPCGETFPL